MMSIWFVATTTWIAFAMILINESSTRTYGFPEWTGLALFALAPPVLVLALSRLGGAIHRRIRRRRARAAANGAVGAAARPA